MKTKAALEQLGVSVKLFDTWNDKLENFDILHVFGSVKDCLPMMELATQKKVKIILSTICWYSWKAAFGTSGTWTSILLYLFRQAAKEFLPFLPSQRKRMMQLSDVLLPNSQTEAEQLKQYFCVPSERIQIIPNGVDESFSRATPDAFHAKYEYRDFVLCVGRIEPRKNQLNLIKALNGISSPVLIVGDYVPQYKNYYEGCKKSAGSNIHFLGSLPHDSGLLASAYAACHTFVLTSWLETPGLAALEAGLAGANVVITPEGATREYFADHADYAAPDRIRQIREKVLASLKRPKDDSLRRVIFENYLWENTAQKTLQAYQKLLT